MAKKTKQQPEAPAPKTDLAQSAAHPIADELRREFNIALDRMANKLIRTMHVIIEKKLGATPARSGS